MFGQITVHGKSGPRYHVPVLPVWVMVSKLPALLAVGT